MAQQRERTRMRRVGVHGGIGRRVGACVHVARELETFGGACEARSGRFWWQWTDLDEIYPMELSVS